MASRRAYSNPAMRQAPQAAWAATRRPPSEKGGAGMPLIPQKPQPSKRQLQLQQQLQTLPGIITAQGAGGGSKPLVAGGAGAVPGRKPPVILPRVNRQQQQAPFLAAQSMLSSSSSASASAVAAGATAVPGDPNARPTLRALSLLALQRGAPFIGFGIVDNAIMIVAGDYIEMSIGVTLGIGTMTAAALGNILADVVGLNLGGLIEEASHRMGIPEPVLSTQQRAMGVTRAVTYAGSSLGIALGCLLGMLPLLFITHTAKEEHPGEVFQTLAHRAAALLGCQRAVVYQLDPATGRVLQEYSSGGRKQTLPRPFADEIVQQTLATREALRYRRERPWLWHQQQQQEEDESLVIDGGALEALTTTVPRPQQQHVVGKKVAGVENALCIPVFDSQGRAVAVLCVVNRLATTNGGGFGREDARALAGLCAQASGALTNLTRRPEEHVSLSESLEVLAAHSALPLRAYRPSLRALLAAEEMVEEKGTTTEIRVPIAIASAAAATVGPANVRAPAAPAVGGEGAR